MKPCVLSIAGFDPSGGAGVLADCKTFEVLACQGFAVVTALTHQHESEVRGIQWLTLEEIHAQLAPLLDMYPIAAIKIGIVRSADMVRGISSFIRGRGVVAPIIWDPVWRASAGLTFFEGAVEEIPFSEIDLLTPNCTELCWLAAEDDPTSALRRLKGCGTVYVKNYDVQDTQITNILALGEQEFTFEVERINAFAKHGSGCVLSAAIAAGVAKGNPLRIAIRQAEAYVRRFLLSDSGLLGSHSPQEGFE